MNNPLYNQYQQQNPMNGFIQKFNQFRQIVKFLNKVENVAEMNNLKTITLPVLEGILNEK